MATVSDEKQGHFGDRKGVNYYSQIVARRNRGATHSKIHQSMNAPRFSVWQTFTSEENEIEDENKMGDDIDIPLNGMRKQISASVPTLNDKNDSNQRRKVMASRMFSPSAVKDGAGNNKDEDWYQRTEKLLILGQGCVELYQILPQPFRIKLFNSKSESAYSYSIMLTVSSKEAKIEFVDSHDTIILAQSKDAESTLRDKGGSFTYWFSIDDHNNTIRYGTGELRLNNCSLEWSMDNSIYDDEFEMSLAKLIANIDSVTLLLHMDNVNKNMNAMNSIINNEIDKTATNNKVLSKKNDKKREENDFAFRVWRDPVTVEPPIKVVSRNDVTMEDIAKNSVTVIDNLPLACQILYWNVCGEQITLNDKSFPQFSDAIEESINDKNGWCYKKLVEKSKGHGPGAGAASNQKAMKRKPNLNGTYLRITLGKATGNSPGCPFVMEIWPPGHYSPIHNHADAYAIIRVLYGEIEVSLFPHLSQYYQKELTKQIFQENDITYILPGLNQTHKLKNISKNKTCVTLQCYQYGDSNSEHYEYFDYLNPATDDIHQFEPTSDCDFIDFKEIVKKEYEARHSK